MSDEKTLNQALSDNDGSDGDSPSAAGEGTVCPQCGKISPPGMRFCGNCGAPLTFAANPASVEEVAPAKTDTPPAAAVSAMPPSLPGGTSAAPAASVPAAAAAPVAPPPIDVPKDPLVRDRERNKLLTLVNVQRMRGQLSEALTTLDQAMFLTEGSPPKEIAPLHELRGDLLASLFRFDEAKDAYGKSHEIDQERASAEKKFATMLLRTSGAGPGLTAADALLHGDSSVRDIMSGGVGGQPGKRNPGMAMLLSFFVPGFGQLYNGHLVKALLCLGIFLMTLLAIRLSPDSEALFRKIAALTAAKPVPGADNPVSPLLWFLILLSAVVWVYSLADASITASRKSDTRTDGGPAIDKTGWEV